MQTSKEIIEAVDELTALTEEMRLKAKVERLSIALDNAVKMYEGAVTISDLWHEMHDMQVKHTDNLTGILLNNKN